MYDTACYAIWLCDFIWSYFCSYSTCVPTYKGNDDSIATNTYPYRAQLGQGYAGALSCPYPDHTTDHSCDSHVFGFTAISIRGLCMLVSFCLVGPADAKVC